MLNLQLEISETETSIDPLSMGYMTLRGNKGKASSKNTPKGDMMIFISVTDLLDGIKKFMTDGQATKYDFIGTDSSFGIVVKKLPDNQMMILVGSQIIGLQDEATLLKGIYEGTLSFTKQYMNQLPSDSSVYLDLQDSLEEFQEFYKTYY